MLMTFRWYGEKDPVTLAQIRQIPSVQGIVSALHDLPVGDVWPVQEIRRHKRLIEAAGMKWSVVESVPVHESIKMGDTGRDRYIEQYCQTLRHLSQEGIRTVCYNFMPLFDWLRTSTAFLLPDGSTTLAYNEAEVDESALLRGDLRLPAWNLSEQRDELTSMMHFYRALTKEQLWENLNYFLRAVMPCAKEYGIDMAIHPDDPPWSVLGLPRIIGGRESYERLVAAFDDDCNGICFCSGSLGSNPDNDLSDIIHFMGGKGRIHFVHLRNVLITGPQSFYESGHLSVNGSVDMYHIMKDLYDVGFRGPVRPDHGRMIWGESGNPGYGLFDRALGAMYLSGIGEAIEKGLGATV